MRGLTDTGTDLQLAGHPHNVVVGGVVLVAVGEHESDVSSKLLGVPVLPAVHLPLRKKRQTSTAHTHNHVLLTGSPGGPPRLGMGQECSNCVVC